MLGAIERYNFDDVRSTWQLHGWLESLRPAQMDRLEREAPDAEEEAARRARRDEREVKERAALAALGQWVDGQPDDEQLAARQLADLLGQLLGFYWRCALPGLWRKFQRMEQDDTELLDDMECLAQLTFTASAAHGALSTRYRYDVPEQESKLFSGAAVVCLTDEGSAANFEYDADAGTASFTRGNNAPAPPQLLTLCVGDPYKDQPKLDAIYRFIHRLCAGDITDGALLGLLRRQRPRIHGKADGGSLVTDVDLQSIIALIKELDASHLVIQGPPGTGKTTIASQVIANLLASGKRVGITSNSHAVINHLLNAAYVQACNDGTGVRAVVVKPADDLADGIRVVGSDDVDSSHHNLVGGTAWLFCRPGQRGKWDYLFVDEASQVSLADLVAAGACARNIVLLGDQMQLPQPTQGTHPGDSGFSALDYLMQQHATVPADRGIFLGVTQRMHPRVCAPVSQGIYEGRLDSAQPCEQQCLLLGPEADPVLQPAGHVYVSVLHRNRSQSAPEEAQRIQALYASLLRQRWVNRKGVCAAITQNDILVVAPYNAQVRTLRAVLPPGARVGTVDKFQGQEAAVAIVSMTTSDADNLPRSLDFLFSKNRLNVAVSRAKCLAVIVASPALLGIDCSKVEDMPLLNFYSMLTDPRGITAES